MRPRRAALWLLAATLVSIGLAHLILAQGALDGASLAMQAGDLVALTTAVFSLIVAAVGVMRAAYGRPGRRAIQRFLGLPLRDFAFSAAFALITGPTLFVAL